MRKSNMLLILFVLMTCFSAVADDMLIMESRSFRSTILGQEVSFSVCLPEDYYETNANYPVVYLLHGLGDDETSWLEYGRIHQYAQEEVKSRAAIPMIFIMPDGYRNYYVNEYTNEFRYEDMFTQELVPYIDSLFRTRNNSNGRALMGYSMGGFGAFSLHLRHPDIFGAAVPLSISVRTDEQYMTEDASGWDQQWGRLFGAAGMTGEVRLTSWYKEYSPFHALKDLDTKTKKKLNLLIINGDEEETLCRSNEELHLVMHKHSIPHEYRVVDGGHSFQVWRAALPVALGFISDFFDERQQANIARSLINTPAKANAMMQPLEIESWELNVFLPYEYISGNRKYPVIYFTGPYLAEEQQFIADVTNDLIKKNKVAPVVLIFLPESSLLQLDVLLPAIEKRLRVREGKRMRALAGYAESAAPVLERCAGGDFSSCLLLNGNLGMPIKLLGENVFSGNETRVFQVAPDQGSSVEGNGMLHILLREKNIRHEYRLVAGSDGFESLQPVLEEVITYTINRFHR